MVIVAGYSSRKKELKEVLNEIRLNAAKFSDDSWEIEGYSELLQFVKYIESKDLLDLACIDVSSDESVTVAEWIRKINNDATIMIFAGTDVSPVKYMKPSIMAASLLVYPFSQQQLKDTIADLFRYLSSKKGDDVEDAYVIKTKEERRRIPYERILFFEARNKRIYLNTAQKEYGFYETFDNLLNELPPYFARCHRGFIVNTRKIKNISLSQNIIELEKDTIIPLSKSYKSVIKELSYDR